MGEWKKIKDEPPPTDGSIILVGDEFASVRVWFTNTAPLYRGPEFAGMKYWMPFPKPPTEASGDR